MQLQRVGNGQTAGGKVMQTVRFAVLAVCVLMWLSLNGFGTAVNGCQETDLGMAPPLAFLLSRGLWTVGIFLSDK